jgi:hypothetical protein
MYEAVGAVYYFFRDFREDRTFSYKLTFKLSNTLYLLLYNSQDEKKYFTIILLIFGILPMILQF